MIARVFPRRTKATPDDELAFFGPPGLFPPKVSEVHVSATFTWDIPAAERLARQWEGVAPVKIGGPAFGKPSGEFVPGRYLRNGWVITSRGCPNRCWFCYVWKREPELVELPVRDGWIVQDDNLLACSEAHIRAVAAMLKRQPHPADLRGLEAKLLCDWHVDLLLDLKPKQIFFAYDTEDDWEPLEVAARKLFNAGFRPSSNVLRCYCLVGYKGDTFEAAEDRLKRVCGLGVYPFAMLMRNADGKRAEEWKRFVKPWCRPASIWAIQKAMAV